MPDLKDGESAPVQGSARAPYMLKNVGGVYSCTCPAWRNQSLPIERRTCKHLRAFRGEQAEQQRLGSLPAPSAASTPKGKTTAPKLLLAQTWGDATDPRGWWMSEKLDGVRAWWDGQKLLSRQGNTYHAPAWFTAGLPGVPFDGELWLERKAFQRTVSIVRRHDQSDHWRQIRFVVFDAPAATGPFEARQAFLQEMFRETGLPYQVMRYRGIERYLCLVLIAHLLLTHLGAAALGAQAEPERTKPLDLPSVPQLQTSLRSKLWDDNINSMEKGSRNRQVGKKLKQILLLDT